MSFLKKPRKKYYALSLSSGVAGEGGGGGGGGGGVTGGLTFWFNGLPAQGIVRATVPTTGMDYWFNGLPTPVIK
jgi:hypothetical protein